MMYVARWPMLRRLSYSHLGNGGNTPNDVGTRHQANTVVSQQDRELLRFCQLYYTQ